MELFNIGPLELIIILLLMFLILGPKESLLMAQRVGKWIREAVRSPIWREIMGYSQEIRELPQKIMEDTGLKETLKEVRESTQAAAEEVNQTVKQSIDEARVPEMNTIRVEGATVAAPELTGKVQTRQEQSPEAGSGAPGGAEGQPAGEQAAEPQPTVREHLRAILDSAGPRGDNGTHDQAGTASEGTTTPEDIQPAVLQVAEPSEPVKPRARRKRSDAGAPGADHQAEPEKTPAPRRTRARNMVDESQAEEAAQAAPAENPVDAVPARKPRKSKRAVDEAGATDAG